jgi:hypothetical protein
MCQHLSWIPQESSNQVPQFWHILAHFAGIPLLAVPAHTRNARHKVLTIEK